MLKKLILLVGVFSMVTVASAKVQRWSETLDRDASGNTTFTVYADGDDSTAGFEIIRNGVWPDLLTLEFVGTQATGDTLGVNAELEFGVLTTQRGTPTYGGTKTAFTFVDSAQAVADDASASFSAKVDLSSVTPRPYARIIFTGTAAPVGENDSLSFPNVKLRAFNDYKR